MKKYTDDEIIDSLRNPENTSEYEILSFLYKDYIKWAGSILSKRGNKQIDLKELFQRSMIIFCEKVKDTSTVFTCELSTYFYSVCQRKCWEMEREDKKNRVIEYNPDLEYDNEYVNLTKEDIWLVENNDKRILKCFEQLDDIKKKVIIDCYYNNLSMDQIAKKRNITNADNAKTIKSRAIKTLRKCMGLK